MINFSVKKPYTVIVSVILILVLGVVSLTNMPPELFPSLDLPYALVMTTYEDASPEQVELMVTRPLEQSLAAVSNVKEVQSTSSEGRSMVTLEFLGDTNMDSALIEVRESLDMLSDFLPEDVSKPTILRLNPNMLPVMNVSVSREGETIEEASSFFEDTILPNLEGTEGVASVDASGLLSKELNITLNEEALEDLNASITEDLSALPDTDSTPFLITPDSIQQVIQAQNLTLPVGLMHTPEGQYMLRLGEGVLDKEDLENLLVYHNALLDLDVRLSDVATVSEDILGATTYSKVNGEEAVFFTFQKQSDVPTTEVTGNILEKLEALETEHEGLSFTVMMNQGNYINQVVDNIWSNLLIGGGLAIIILVLFLRDLRPSIVIGLSIPVSVITALILMYFSGVTLNIISMGGLALGVGMLVDNSIVVFENIYRLRSKGLSSKEAAIEGTKEVLGAIVASTLTTVSVFLPIVFTSGITRQIFVDMGLTIAYSLLASLLIAVTFVPMISARSLKKDLDKKKGERNGLQRGYTSLLSVALKFRFITLFFALLLFGLSIFFALKQGVEFFPQTNTPELTGSVVLVEEDQDFPEALDALGALISDEESVLDYGLVTENALFSMGDSENRASVNIILDPATSDSVTFSDHLTKEAEELGLELRLNQNTGDTSALTGGGLEVQVQGDNYDTLEEIITDLEDRLQDVSGIGEIDNGITKSEPEFRIEVDKDEALKSGLTIIQIYEALREPLETLRPFSQLDFTGDAVNMYFREPVEKELSSEDELRNFTLETPQGDITLRDIATITEVEGYSSIERIGGRRTLSMTLTPSSDENIGILGERVQGILDETEIPQGYQVKLGGELEQIEDSFKDLALMLLLGILFIYLIMVAQFESLLSPFIVMFTVPLAFTGGLLALLVTNNPVSVVAALGFIILAGVIVNNGIVLISYIDQLRNRGMNKGEAIIEASVSRLRPILMTALTTILGLVPLALGIGGGAELLAPMAITSIGGLLYGTIMTLFVVPSLYSIIGKR